jgi:hypothetical protein
MKEKESMKKLALVLGALLVVLAVPAMVSASDWPEFQMDKENSGVTGDSAPIETPTTSWSYDVCDGWVGIHSTPVVYNGYVYAFTAEVNLTKHSLDGTAAGGNWPVSLDDPSGYDFQNGGIAAANGHLYVVDSGGSSRHPYIDLYSINATDGNIDYSENVTDDPVQFSTPVTYTENRGNKYILFGSVNMSGIYDSDGGKYYCYNVNNSSNLIKVWERNCTSPKGYYWAGAAVIGDFAVFGDDAGNLTSVNFTNVTNGEPELRDQVNVSDVFGVDAKEIRSSVSYSEETGRIYFTSKGGYCYAMDFNANTGDIETTVNDRWNTTIGQSTSTPVYYNDRIYAGYYLNFNDGGLWCLNAADGSPCWCNSSIGPIQSSPAISTFYDTGEHEEYVYVTTNSASGGVHCVSNNTTVWAKESPGTNKYCLGGAAISCGRVFYGNDGGWICGESAYTLYNFKVRAGEDKWAFEDGESSLPGNNDAISNTPFSSYTEIEADDALSDEYQTGEDGVNASQQFIFKVRDPVAINITWIGSGDHDTGTDGVRLYVWRNGSGYQYFDESNSAAEDTLYANITSDANSYIVDGNVTILVMQKDQHNEREGYTSTISTDYVEMVFKP